MCWLLKLHRLSSDPKKKVPKKIKITQSTGGFSTIAQLDIFFLFSLLNKLRGKKKAYLVSLSEVRAVWALA